MRRTLEFLVIVVVFALAVGVLVSSVSLAGDVVLPAVSTAGGQPRRMTPDDSFADLEKSPLGVQIKAMGEARTAALETWRNNRVSGYHVTAPTTPSSQASGAVAPVWRINWDSLFCVIRGTFKNFAAAVDSTIASPPILAVGESVVVVRFIIKNDAGTVYVTTLIGTPATTGQQIAPTDAQIRAYIATAGGGPYSDTGYLRLAKLTLNRTGDTTLTQSQDNTWRDF